MSRPHTMPAPVVEPDVDETPFTDDGDHDRFAHYVSRKELERARRTGKPVTALCGKRWVPNADPSKYPMCPTCAELAGELLSRGLGE
ncbi:MAG: DUF3039 domain-containing protein [Nitriliruptoraceae bacterium]